MEIKKLSPEHFSALRDFLDGVFSRSYGRETRFAVLFPRLFEKPNDYVTSSHLGAFDGDRLIGTAAMYPLDYVVGGRHIRLIANGNVAVHEAYRGQGVMTSILHAINDACDISGDVGYLHGNPVRYGRVGYVGCGIEYLLTFQPGKQQNFDFPAMRDEDIPFCRARSEENCDYIVRTDRDFIPALRSGHREAISVFRGGTLAGYLSLNRESGAVEEFGFGCDTLSEVDVFSALAAELDKPVRVRLSGYNAKVLARCRDHADVQIGQPALFRVIHREPLMEAACALGLADDTLYAPYLT